MRRRVPGILVIALLAVVIPAREASALEGLMRWLERLSGPGPFIGWGVGIPLGCVKPNETNPEERFAPWGCGPGDMPVQISFEFSHMKGTSDLSYAPARPDKSDRRLTILSFAGVYEARVRKPLDVGGAIGFMRFSGNGFSGFSRLTIEPLRATLRPLQLFNIGSERLQKIIEVRGSTTWIPGGFKAEDFGAVPGTFDSGAELQSSCYIVLDFGKLIWGG